MSPETLIRSHSSAVELFLQIGVEKLPAAQVGGGSVVLREPATIASSTSARVIVIVDGHERSREVFICHGVEDARRVEYI